MNRWRVIMIQLLLLFVARIKPIEPKHLRQQIFSASLTNALRRLGSFDCSYTLIQSTSSLSESLPIENFNTAQGISIQNYKINVSEGPVDVVQKRNDCNLVVALVTGTHTNHIQLEDIEKKGKTYFIFISYILSDVHWLKLHQPYLKYKLYVFQNGNGLTLISTFTPLPKLNCSAKIFTLNPSPSAWTSLSEIFPKHFAKYGFQGNRLKVTVSTLVKYLVEIRNGTSGLELRRGLDKYLFSFLMQKFNFTSDVRVSSHGGSTGRFVKGSWTGAIGDIYYNKADISTSIGMMSQRYRVVSYSTSYTYAAMTFVVASPRTRYTWKSVYRPLTYDSWVLLLLSIFISIIIVKLMVSAKLKLKALIWFIFDVLLENSSSRVTNMIISGPLRPYFGMWFIFSIVVGTAYRSKLIGILMFPEMTPIPNTFEEVADSEFSLVLQYFGGVGYEKLRTSTNPSHQIIFNKVELQPDNVKCLEAALQNHTICIIWKELVEYARESYFAKVRGNLPFITSFSTIFFTPIGITMRKNSHAMESLDKVIGWATCLGIMDKWSQMDYAFINAEGMLLNSSYQPSNEKIEDSGGLNLHQLQGAFLMLSIGLVISTIVFISNYLKGLKEITLVKRIELGEKN